MLRLTRIRVQKLVDADSVYVNLVAAKARSARLQPHGRGVYALGKLLNQSLSLVERQELGNGDGNESGEFLLANESTVSDTLAVHD